MADANDVRRLALALGHLDDTIRERGSATLRSPPPTRLHPAPHHRKVLGPPRCNGGTRSAPSASELNRCSVAPGSARSG